MKTHHPLPVSPVQLLPRESYLSQDWYDLEQRDLFGTTWAFAGTVHDVPDAGDYRTVQAGPYSLIMLRNAAGELQGFHNICRHRGTELLEDCGNVGKTIVCPYHNWVYALDGNLRGVPAQAACFPGLDKARNGLHKAAIGIYRDLVFIHPEAEPSEPFEVWIDDLASVPWPHDLAPGGLVESSDEIVYEMQCNWKVFAENALDGYHLAYLHKKTLGGPTYDKNLWQAFGRHLVWWSTERDGVKHRIPRFVEDAAKTWPAREAHAARDIGYGGVYLLFPTTLLTPNPWGFSISVIEPAGPGVSLLRVRNWAPKGMMSYRYSAKDAPGFDRQTGLVKSSHWTMHPLETGDFQTEDVWVCEKMQRALASPRHRAAHLARGAGGEAALAHFQGSVLGFVGQNHAVAAQ
ncbi:MAG: SRPBCC family protein [Pseudomonadota bacterium]